MKNNPCIPKPEYVSISSIDFSDTAYCLFPQPEAKVPDKLRDSITRAGILHPPILKKKSAEKFLIITGRTRLRVAQEINPENKCCCLILPPETPDIKIFEIMLAEITASRPCTLAEQALFLKNILTHINEEEAAQRFLPLMGLPAHHSYIKRLLVFLEMEEPLLIDLHKGLLDETVARQLLTLSFRDRFSLFEIIKSLKMGAGKQKKFVAACRELSTREKTGIAELLEIPEVQRILDNKKANAPQQAANLMAWLSRKLTPRLSAAEKDFRLFIGKLELPGNAEVHHSPSFEQDAVTLRITFADREKLAQTWKDIKPAIAKY